MYVCMEWPVNGKFIYVYVIQIGHTDLFSLSGVSKIYVGKKIRDHSNLSWHTSKGIRVYMTGPLFYTESLVFMHLVI